jgi:hypothetical protein
MSLQEQKVKLVLEIAEKLGKKEDATRLLTKLDNLYDKIFIDKAMKSRFRRA